MNLFGSVLGALDPMGVMGHNMAAHLLDPQKPIRDAMVQPSASTIEAQKHLAAPPAPGGDGHRKNLLVIQTINGLPPATLPAAQQATVVRPSYPGSAHSDRLPLNTPHPETFVVSEHVVKWTPRAPSGTLDWYQVMRDPRAMVVAIWDTLKGTVGYILWNYQDLVEQFRSWDGTVLGLFRHTQLMWRSLVSVGLTLVLVELGPFLEAMVRLLTELVEILWKALGMVGRGVEELWWFVQLLWQDATALVDRITTHG